LLDLAAARFSRVFVDLPPAWADWTLPVLARSDLIVIVTTPSVTGVLGAHRALQALSAAGLSGARLLVLNRMSGLFERLEKPSQVQRALEQRVDASVPFDPAVLKASDRGALLAQASPKSAPAKALRELHRKIE